MLASAGAVPSAPRVSVSVDDEVAMEATGNALAILEGHVAPVVL